MKAYLRSGLAPASAMRSTWADVRRGQVARPPRRARRNERPSARELVHVDLISGRRATHNPGVRGNPLWISYVSAYDGHRKRALFSKKETPKFMARAEAVRGDLIRSGHTDVRIVKAPRPRKRREWPPELGNPPYSLHFYDGKGDSVGTAYDRHGAFPTLARARKTGYRIVRSGARGITDFHVTDEGAPAYSRESLAWIGRKSDLTPHQRERRPRPRTNPRPTLARVGQLVAMTVRQSGADLDAVADAHAQVYGYPRGDVWEMARRWLEREGLRNPGLFRAIGRGVKRGYHKYRASRFEEKARAQRRKAAQYNPLSRAETAAVLRGARSDLRSSRRVPNLTAPEKRDPLMVARSRGWWRGRADAALSIAHGYGTRGRRLPLRYSAGGRLKARPYIGPNPPGGGVLIYDRVLKVFAQKGRGPHRGQRFVHHFRSSPRMLGLPNGDLLITGR
jgi:hypothetical protein